MPPIGPGSWPLALQHPARTAPLSGLGGGRGLVAARLRLHRAAQGHHPSRRPGGLERASRPLGRRLRLRDRTARRLRPPRRPPAELADAVAASCAIPAFYHPVEIAGRRYVDGGIYSTSNLDLVRDEGLDLVVCLNPTSSLHPTRAWNPVERVASVFRDASGRRLGSEAKKLRARGTEVVLIQPTREDLDAMGPNLMSRKNRNPVIAHRPAHRRRRSSPGPRTRELLATCRPATSGGSRRPSGDPADWPDLNEIRALVSEHFAARA